MAVFALPGRLSGVTMVISPYSLGTPLSFVSRRHRPCVWYASHGRREATSDRLIASSERQVTIIPLTIGLLSGDRSLDSRKSSNSFPGIEKKDRDSRVSFPKYKFNVPVAVASSLLISNPKIGRQRHYLPHLSTGCCCCPVLGSCSNCLLSSTGLPPPLGSRVSMTKTHKICC